MQASIFNVRVPLPASDEVFLMNTLTDAQFVVSSDVAALLDGTNLDEIGRLGDEGQEALALLKENGFLVPSRDHDRQAIDAYLERVTSDSSELHITLLTTLQCNFACDYCYQGDRGDYSKFAEKMTLETAERVGDWVEREIDRMHP